MSIRQSGEFQTHGLLPFQVELWAELGSLQIGQVLGANAMAYGSSTLDRRQKHSPVRDTLLVIPSNSRRPMALRSLQPSVTCTRPTR